MKLHELKPAAGSRHRRKIVGRGPGSGHGKTAGRGEKGQGHRAAGNAAHPWFEGGQLPLHRRLPKRGFTNLFREEVAVCNVQDLERFEAGTAVTPARLAEAGVVKSGMTVKILGKGSLSKALTVSAHRFSKGATEKIRSAGGTVEVIAS